MSFSTSGRMFRTMMATPSGVGCKPSARFNAWHARHVLQEERIKPRAEPFRKPGIHRTERIVVIRPPIARRLHAGEQKLDVFLFQGLENSRKRWLRHLRIDAAQRVVGAKLDDGAIHLFIEAPFEAREPVRRRIAGHARIQHADRIALFPERRLQLRRKRLIRRDMVARAQAVAKGKDRDFVLILRPGARARPGTRYRGSKKPQTRTI